MPALCVCRKEVTAKASAEFTQGTMMNKLLNIIRSNRLLEPLCLALTICFTLPFTVYYFNLSEFPSMASPLLLVACQGFLLVFIPLFLLTYIGHRTEKFISFFCLTLATFILLVTFLFPIQSGLQDGTDLSDSMEYIWGINTQYLVFFAVIIGALLAYFIKKSLLRDFIYFTSVLSFFWVGYISYVGFDSDWKLAEVQVQKSDAFRISRDKKNIILISLDSVQGDVVNDILEESSEYGDLFDGFTHFQDVTGTAPFTNLSLPIVLLGSLPELTHDEFLKKASEENFVDDLSEAGYDTSIYFVEKCTQFSKPYTKLNQNFSVEGGLTSNISFLFHAVISRILPHTLQEILAKLTQSSVNNTHSIHEILKKCHLPYLQRIQIKFIRLKTFF